MKKHYCISLSRDKVEKAKVLLKSKNIKNKSTGKKILTFSGLLDTLLEKFIYRDKLKNIAKTLKKPTNTE